MKTNPKIFATYNCPECHKKASVGVFTMTPQIWRCSHCVSVFNDLKELLTKLAD